jgi:hypothetical protein
LLGVTLPLFEEIFAVYWAGRWPCGWEGICPAGRLLDRAERLVAARKLAHNGRRQSLPEWPRETGISKNMRVSASSETAQDQQRYQLGQARANADGCDANSDDGQGGSRNAWRNAVPSQFYGNACDRLPLPSLS